MKPITPTHYGAYLCAMPSVINLRETIMPDLQIQTVTYGAFLSLLLDDFIEVHEVNNPEIVDAVAVELDLIEAICIADPATLSAFFHCVNYAA